jgi:hypothetical protein
MGDQARRKIESNLHPSPFPASDIAQEGLQGTRLQLRLSGPCSGESKHLLNQTRQLIRILLDRLKSRLPIHRDRGLKHRDPGAKPRQGCAKLMRDVSEKPPLP